MNCRTTDCTNPVHARGLCRKHYLRARRSGALSTIQKHKLRPGPISYQAAHDRVSAALGPVRSHSCRWCRTRPAQQWAYTHTDPHVMFSPEGWPYSANPQHYIALCISCHKRLDRGMTEWERAHSAAA